jgi:hypothetical protein
MWYILLFVMWFSPYVFINVSTFNQCDIYFCLSWFSSYVFINVRTFNQCDIYFCLSCGFHPMCLLMSGLSTNVIYTSVCHVVFTLCVYKCQDFQPMWYILLFVMWFSPCVYKCQYFQPMWYILLFVMWFSSYVFINVRTFNQCDIYFCLSCGFHPMCL